jgi:hypothetical protein
MRAERIASVKFGHPPRKQLVGDGHVVDVCRNVANHTLGPEGYIQWEPWARRMSKTHRQMKCPHCGLYTMWVPK